MSRFNLLQVPMVMVSLSCSAQVSAPTQPVKSKTEEFVYFGDKFFESINSIKSKRTHHKVEKIKNQHMENQIDELHTDTYTGFRVVFLRAKSVPNDLLSSLTISDPAIKLPFGITIGNSVAEITKVLGQPSSLKGSVLEYEIADIQTDTVYFKFVKGRLAEVKWSYEID